VRQLTEELRSAWRFRWHAVAAAWSIGIVGLGVVAWLPDIYQAGDPRPAYEAHRDWQPARLTPEL
jgi:hypothetical protein